MGRCNTIGGTVDRKGGGYGTDRATGAYGGTEVRALATVEGRAVDVRDRTCAWAAFVVDFSVASSYGGFVPAIRRRALIALTLAEREDISRGIAAGRSVRQIAGQLGRSPSTVSREVVRHGGRPRYRATEAEFDAWESGRRPKRCLLAMNRRLQSVVAGKLSLDWSPEQVSGWLKIQFPDDEGLRVSHETIYRNLDDFLGWGPPISWIGTTCGGVDARIEQKVALRLKTAFVINKLRSALNAQLLQS